MRELTLVDGGPIGTWMKEELDPSEPCRLINLVHDLIC
jgi:hypothetical protein